MDKLRKAISGWAGRNFTTRAKSVEYPTVSGGFDIFRGLSWDDSMNQTKALRTYGKSMYIFAVVSKIARKVASIEWNLFKIKDRAGNIEELFVHEALDLLYKPNPFQTKDYFFEIYMLNKLLAGQAFVLKVRDERGKVQELWNLRPDLVTIVRDKKQYIKAFAFDQDGKEVLFDPEDIIFDMYPNPLDELAGFSALFAAKNRIANEEYASNYQVNFFKNNARPDFIVYTDDMLSEDQKERLYEKWDKRLRGELQYGKGAILDSGLKYQTVSISQRDMEYIEGMKFTRDDILMAFGMPKTVMAITDNVNLANAETGMKIYLEEVIEPEDKRLTIVFNEGLVYTEYADNLYIEHESVVPENEKEKAELQKIRIESGTMLINEAREEWGQDPIMGGWTLYKPLNEVAVGGMPQGTKSAKLKSMQDKRRIFRGRGKAYEFLTIKEGIKNDMYKALAMELNTKAEPTRYIKEEVREVYAEVINKQIDQSAIPFKDAIVEFSKGQYERLLKAIELEKSVKFAEDEYKAKLKKWADSEEKLMADFSLPYIEEILMEAGINAMNLVNPAEDFNATDRVTKYIKDRAKEMAHEVTRTTLERISNTLAVGLNEGEGIAQLTDRVEKLYSEFPTWRAETIARTEATGANNRGFIESYRQSGVANAKEWIATGDDRTRTSHMHAMDQGVIGLDEKFGNGMEYPGDPRGGAEETVNCRCVLAPAFRE